MWRPAPRRPRARARHSMCSTAMTSPSASCSIAAASSASSKPLARSETQVLDRESRRVAEPLKLRDAARSGVESALSRLSALTVSPSSASSLESRLDRTASAATRCCSLSSLRNRLRSDRRACAARQAPSRTRSDGGEGGALESARAIRGAERRRLIPHAPSPRRLAAPRRPGSSRASRRVAAAPRSSGLHTRFGPARSTSSGGGASKSDGRRVGVWACSIARDGARRVVARTRSPSPQYGASPTRCVARRASGRGAGRLRLRTRTSPS